MVDFTLSDAEAKRAEVAAAYAALAPFIRLAHRAQAAYHTFGATLEEADVMVTALETEVFGPFARADEGGGNKPPG